MRYWRGAILGLLVVVAVVVGSTSAEQVTDAARVQHLSETLRCPVCNGLAVADSPSSTARAIAADIRRMVGEGQTDEQIIETYVARYGTWILLEPPTSGFAAMAWLLPVGFVAGAIGVLVVTLRQRFQRGQSAVSESDRRRVERARGATPAVDRGPR